MISDSCYYPPRRTTFVVLIYASAMVVCITGRRVWVQQPSSWGSLYSGRGCPKPIEFSLEFHHRTSPSPPKMHVCKPLGSRLLFRVSAAPQLYVPGEGLAEMVVSGMATPMKAWNLTIIGESPCRTAYSKVLRQPDSRTLQISGQVTQ